MYKLTQEHIDWIFSSPSCRYLYRSGDSHCAIGKFVAAIGGKDVWNGFNPGYEAGNMYLPPAAHAIVVEMMNTMCDEQFSLATITNMNDMGPGLRNAHYNALKTLIDRAIQTGFIEVEDSLAAEFSERIKQVTTG